MLRQQSILIVERENDFRELLKFSFKRHFGLDVCTARDGFEALSIMETGLIDLMIANANIPFINGIHLVSIVKTVFSQTKIVALLADHGGRYGICKNEIKEMGADCVIDKVDLVIRMLPKLSQHPPPKHLSSLCKTLSGFIRAK